MNLRRQIAFLLSVLMAGCHVHIAAEPQMLERGDRVRVHLARPAEYRLREMSPANIVRVDGEVAQVTDTTLVLSAWWLRSASGLEYAGEGWTVHVRREDVQRLEERRVSGVRTGLLVAGGVAAAALLGAAALSGGSDGPPGNGGNGQTQ